MPVLSKGGSRFIPSHEPTGPTAIIIYRSVSVWQETDQFHWLIILPFNITKTNYNLNCLILAVIHIELTLSFCFPLHLPLSSTSDFNSLHSLTTDETWESRLLDRNVQIQLIIKFCMFLLRSPAFQLKEDEIKITTECKFFKRCQAFACVCVRVCVFWQILVSRICRDQLMHD